MYEALLVDFYGTLVHEDTDVIDAIVSRVVAASPHAPHAPRAAEVGALWSRRFAELCAAAHGELFRPQREIELESLHEVLDHFAAPLDAESLSAELYAYWEAPTPCEGSARFLDELDLPFCIVSNIDTADLECAIDHLGWSFYSIVTSESSKAYKPRSEPFEAGLRAVGCSASRVLHVGDSVGSDLSGAAALGIASAWVNPRARPLPSGARPAHVVPSVYDLLQEVRA